VDNDLHQSYFDTLNQLYEKATYVSLIIFDDFFVKGPGNNIFPGSRLAVKKYLGEDFKNIEPTVGGTYCYINK
jgi:hypothetical protein